MTQTAAELLWTQPEWIEQAHAWIERSLADARIRRTGPIETLHARIWSTVMFFDTEEGRLYFKACDPPTEPRLTQFLAGIQPENIPEVVAADLQQGWMLMRDAGPMLRTHLKQPADLAELEPALVQFAHLQMKVTGQEEALLAMGAFDRRLARLPGMFAEMLEEPEILRLGSDDGLSEAQHQQLKVILPRYTEMCSQLEALPIPQTLHHDDFHDGNIFVSSRRGKRCFVFSDWGESAVAHPFYSMMQCLRSVGSRAGFPDEVTDGPDRMPPELNRLRDVYLQPWQSYTRPDELVAIFNLAWRVGMVSRALTWREFVLTLDAQSRGDFTYIVPAWLQEFLKAMETAR